MGDRPVHGGAWVCSQCGAEVDEGFDQCWQCGATVAGEEDAGFVPVVLEGLPLVCPQCEADLSAVVGRTCPRCGEALADQFHEIPEGAVAPADAEAAAWVEQATPRAVTIDFSRVDVLPLVLVMAAWLLLGPVVVLALLEGVDRLEVLRRTGLVGERWYEWVLPMVFSVAGFAWLCRFSVRRLGRRKSERA